MGPPRLAAGAGDRGAETLNNIPMSHHFAGFSLRFLLRSGRGPPRGRNGERQLALGARLASQYPIQVDGGDAAEVFSRAPARPGAPRKIQVSYLGGGCPILPYRSRRTTPKIKIFDFLGCA